MLSYSLKYRKNTESKKSKVEKIKNGRTMFSLNCVVCGNKKLRFIKEQEAKGLLSIIGKIPLLSDSNIYYGCT